MGIFEHVATHLDFRRRGFGRAVMMEGLRRIAALGATRAWVGSGQEFYAAIGFQKKYVCYNWIKEF
jgi:predicted N-acetyltransferase YhbS